MPLTPQESSHSDDSTSSWRKIARNLWIEAVAEGYVGTLEPNGLDAEMQSMRKACQYTAELAP